MRDDAIDTYAGDPRPDDSRLEGRIAFTTGAFALAFALIGLLDRVGAPKGLVGVLAPYFTMIALATLGFLLHSMRVSAYYAASRAAPAYYAGLANAAIVAGLALPFLARFSWPASLGDVLAGLAAGAAGVALFVGPLLRKTGAFSLPALLAARFGSVELRLGLIAATAAASGLVALAGYRTAVDALVGFTGTERAFAAFLIGVAVLSIAGPGGLSGVVWGAAAAAGVAITAFGLSAAALALRGHAPPLPFLGDAQAWGDAVVQMEALRVLAPPLNPWLGLCAMVALAIGSATLAPSLAPSLTTSGQREARRAGYVTLAWSLVIGALVASTVASSSLQASRAAIGQTPERLPDALYAASAKGFVRICGVRAPDPASARRACLARPAPPSAPLRAEDVTVRGEYLLAGLPELFDLGAAFSSLMASAVVALGLILAASGLHACAAAIGHDAFYRMGDETALTSRRLAITRMALLGVTALGAAMSAVSAIDASTLTSLALSVSTAGVAPVAALALWPRAGDRDAMIAQISGLAVMAAAVAATPGFPSVEIFTAAALAGCCSGGLAGALSARGWSEETAKSRGFVERLLHGDGQVLEPDKGA